MFCSKCPNRLEDNWCVCPFCGTEIDKAGGIDKKELNDFIKTRKDTLDVLEKIILDLEHYGKIQVSFNALSSGVQIASGIAMFAAPLRKISSDLQVAASILDIADCGVTIFTLLKETGLEKKACEILKKDFDNSKKVAVLLPKICACIKIYVDSPLAFRRMSKHEKEEMLKEEKKKWFLKRTKVQAALSVLVNFQAFIISCGRLHRGNYSKVADELKPHLQKLQGEYMQLKSVSQEALTEIVKSANSM